MKRGKNENCPKCERILDPLDDVVEFNGLVYHEECKPTIALEPAVVPEVPESPAKKGKKVAKPTNSEELLQKLLDTISSLSKEVADLKARPAEVATVAPKRSKANKGAPRPFIYYTLRGYPTEKRPPQCLRVMRALAQAAPEGGKMTELDIWNALMAEPFPSQKAHPSLGPWNYVQDPFYIFRYYKLQMIDGDYLLGPFQV